MGLAVHHLDMLGYVCPVPLVRTKEKFATLSSGDILTVETEHARAVRNLLDWASKAGHSVDVEEESDGIWRIILRKE